MKKSLKLFNSFVKTAEGKEIIAYHIAGIKIADRFQDLTNSQKLFLRLGYVEYYKPEQQPEQTKPKDKYEEARKLAREREKVKK